MITRQFTIYKIENQQNGRVYIGCTEKGERRIKQHFCDLERGRHKSKTMQADFENGDTFRAVTLFAFSATVSGEKNGTNSYYIMDTAHAIEKYYIKKYRADKQGYNGGYYAYLYTQWDDSDAPENALLYLSKKIGKRSIKDFCALYSTTENKKNYKPFDLFFSKGIAATIKRESAESSAALFKAHGVTVAQILKAAAERLTTDGETAAAQIKADAAAYIARAEGNAQNAATTDENKTPNT